MRITQIAPLTEAIPPKHYGGTERVISWLTNELVTLGHEVVLFASGDSRTSAKLEACWPKSLQVQSLAGVITKTDVVRQISHCRGSGCITAASTVMTRTVILCRPRDPLPEVVRRASAALSAATREP
jgi:CBS domain-containing protein